MLGEVLPKMYMDYAIVTSASGRLVSDILAWS